MTGKITNKPATPEQLEYRAKRFNLCACCALPRSICMFRPFRQEQPLTDEVCDGSELEPSCHRAGGGIGRGGDVATTTDYGNGEE